MKVLCPNCGTTFSEAEGKLDGRATMWRTRVRLYRDDRADPEADTDPDRAAGQPGEDILRGLPAVAEHVRELALAFHKGPCDGLDTDTLKHRLKSLRPTLSRRGGDAVWRIPYTITTHHGFNSKPSTEAWLARVDVQQESSHGHADEGVQPSGAEPDGD